MERVRRYQDLRIRKAPFNPNRRYVKNAMEIYLKNGGTISKVTLDEKSYLAFISCKNNKRDADEFLLGF
jgi:hypothetical protein